MQILHSRIGILAVAAVMVLAVTLGCDGDPTSVVSDVIEGQLNADTVRVEMGSDGLDTYNGLAVGFTEEGYPFRGDPDAPVTIVEYSDYLCPYCARYFADTMPQLLESHVATGKINMVFREFPLVSLHPTAPIGHQAALCVAEQGAPSFWEMHDQLFLNQQQWNQLADPTDYVTTLGREIAPDKNAFDECFASGRTISIVDEGVAAGEAAGFNGTPSFQFVKNDTGDAYPFIGAQPYTSFVGALDAILAGQAPPVEVEPTPEPAVLPYWANEGLRPDPDRPGLTLAGDPFKGDPDAPVVVAEFSDFQCPACREHLSFAQPAIDEALVDSGQVMWVFKSLPLKLHPQSIPAAVAGQCAAEQGAFWEMQDALFASHTEWAVENPDPVLLAIAEEVVPDAGQFAACLQSRAALERVMADMWDASGVVSETPSFIVIYGGAGRVLRGSMAADQFVSSLENMVSEATSGD